MSNINLVKDDHNSTRKVISLYDIYDTIELSNNNMFLFDFNQDFKNVTGFVNIKHNTIHIFGELSNLPIETPNITIHISDFQLKESSNIMMTWWCCNNIDLLKSYDNIYIISNNRGLKSLENILNNNFIRSTFIFYKQNIKVLPSKKKLTTIRDINLENYDSYNLYLVDYDQQDYLKDLINSINSKYNRYHIFGGFHFAKHKISLPIETTNVTIHISDIQLKEAADIMITWWCCNNIDLLKSYDNIYIISEDKGLKSLENILNNNYQITKVF